MSNNDTKTTLYLSPSVRRALKRRVLETDQTMPQYAIATAIAEDLEDIEAIASRRNDKTESLEEFLKVMEADGLVQN